jgi:hypothetical protein
VSMESDLQTLLATICPRTFPDVAPSDTAAPWVVWQGLGGASLRFVDNTAGDRRNTLMQVAVYAKTRLQALQLIRQIEDAITASMPLIATPQGEPASDYESDTLLYSSKQRYSIWAAR